MSTRATVKLPAPWPHLFDALGRRDSGESGVFSVSDFPQARPWETRLFVCSSAKSCGMVGCPRTTSPDSGPGRSQGLQDDRRWARGAVITSAALTWAFWGPDCKPGEEECAPDHLHGSRGVLKREI